MSLKDDPVIVLTRIFDAPRTLVWAAITDPKHVAQWYGGSGFTNLVCEMDLRPGGAWHHVMRAPNGMRITINSLFEEIVKPERLVWRTAKDASRNPAAPPSVNTVTLEARGAQTKWMLVTRFGSFAERDLTANIGFSQMIGSSLERMAEHLKTLREVGRLV